MTDKVTPLVEEWRSRPLQKTTHAFGLAQSVYAIDFYLEVKSKLILVHVIRNSVKYAKSNARLRLSVGYKNKKEFCVDLKAIYQAPTWFTK